MLEELLHKLYKTSLMEGFIWIMINLIPWLLFGILKAVHRIFRRNEIYNDVHKSGRIKSIILKIGENKAILNASKIIITHIHNGQTWLNGKHIYKLSIYKTLSIYERSHLEARLSDVRLSEISEILEGVEEHEFDIVQVDDLPKDFEFRKVFRKDKIKGMAIIKIHKNKQPLGYIWVVFAGDKQVIFDREVYNDLVLVASEIAKEFA